MQIAAKQVCNILAEHGWSPNPEGYINPFFVEQTDGKFYIDLNSAAVRYGDRPDEMPDYPVRIYLTPLNGPTGTVGFDASEIRELGKDESSTAEARRDFYLKISPWSKTQQKRVNPNLA